MWQRLAASVWELVSCWVLESVRNASGERRRVQVLSQGWRDGRAEGQRGGVPLHRRTGMKLLSCCCSHECAGRKSTQFVLSFGQDSRSPRLYLGLISQLFSLHAPSCDQLECPCGHACNKFHLVSVLVIANSLFG